MPILPAKYNIYDLGYDQWLNKPDEFYNPLPQFETKISNFLPTNTFSSGEIISNWTFMNNLDMGDHKIINIGTPVNNTDVVNKTYVDSLNIVSTATLIVAASDSKDTSRADYICDGTADEAEINQAIAALPASGGRVHLLEGTFVIAASISLSSNCILTGNGMGTILKMKDSAGDVTMITNSDTTNGNFEIIVSDIFFDGNKNNQVSGIQYGIYFVKVGYSSDYTTHKKGCLIKNCIFENFRNAAGLAAILLYQTYHSVIINNIIEGCMHGIKIWGAHNDESKHNIILCNICRNNGYNGIYIGGDHADYNIIANNHCLANTFNGIEIQWGDYNTINHNQCINNGVDGIHIEDSKHNTITNNFIYDNGTNGILLDNGDNNNVQGNTIREGSSQNYGINISNITCTDNFIVNNDLEDSGTTNDLSDSGTRTEIYNNKGLNNTKERKFVEMKNTSGGDLTEGDVIILKAVAAGDEFTTTVNQGDDLVLGMVAESINNNAYGKVQILGKTTTLKVDGTTDIAIGDFIGTFTTAKIGMKATVGDMAFAIALEAYTSNDSNGVIDALLITPRKL